MISVTREPGLQSHPVSRTLAIDPTSRGFGYAVIENSARLIDWGIVHVRTDKESGCLKRIAGLIDYYQPSTIVTEDVSAKSSRRCKRVSDLLGAIANLARAHDIDCVNVTTERMRQCYSAKGGTTKYDIAVTISEQFPELKPSLPKRRKCYESENEGYAVFDAIAFHFGV